MSFFNVLRVDSIIAGANADTVDSGHHSDVV